MNHSKIVRWSRSILFSAALGLPVALVASSALAGPGKGEHDKASAPAVTLDAPFDRYLLTPDGRVDGLLMKDGDIVRAPQPTVRDTSLHSGDVVHIEARAKATPTGTLFVHALVKKNGAVVVDDTAPRAHGDGHKDDGAKHDHAKLADVTAKGKISSLWSGPKGRLLAVILDDGTVGYLHHADTASLGLKRGDQVSLVGKGGSYPLGKSMVVRSVTMPNGSVTNL